MFVWHKSYTGPYNLRFTIGIYLYQLGDLGAGANVKCGIKQNQPRLSFLRVSAPSHGTVVVSKTRLFWSQESIANALDRLGLFCSL